MSENVVINLPNIEIKVICRQVQMYQRTERWTSTGSSSRVRHCLFARSTRTQLREV